MKRYLPFLIIAAVGLSAAGTGALLYRGKTRRVVAATNPAQATHIRGGAQASLTLEEFGDFQCPPCGGLAPLLKEIETEYGPKLRVIFHHLPLAKTHQYALESAYAAEAAGLQGKFWEMHDALYQNQASWSKAPEVSALFNSYAALLGLDLKRFNTDRVSEVVKKQVAADEALAGEAKITNTPTLLINGRVLPTASLNPKDIRTALNSALDEKKQ